MTVPRIGLCGWPLTHSLSPRLHEVLAKLAGIELDYELWAIPPDEFPADFASQVKSRWQGLNITTPYKEQALAACEVSGETPVIVGAANCLWVRPDGSLAGDNKDVDGAFFTLQGIRAAHQSRPLDWMGAVHLLGWGPAARAVGLAYGRFWRAERARCKAQRKPDPGPCHLTIYLREVRPDHQAAQARLVEAMGGTLTFRFAPWEAVGTAQLTGLLVNATTLRESSPLAMLPDGDYAVWDLNYSSPALLTQAQAAGHWTLDGLPMLVWQGFFSAVRWFPGKLDPQRDLRLAAEVLRVLREAP